MNSNKTITIALDAMGGDHAPKEAVRAAAEISRTSAIHTLLVGRPDAIAQELDQVEHNAKQLEVIPATEVIGMGEKPREALRQKKNASIAIAAQAVAAGDANALVSAGSTGALVLAASKHIPRISGVRRTALAAVYPTQERSRNNDRFSLLLDVGATIRCKSQDLLFFAYMGHAYAKGISKIPHPSVGLLNMGEEENKGDEILTTAHQWMRNDPTLNFIGNVEGTDIPRGIADVIVCEGFVGNVVLKMAEGMSEVFTNLGKWAFKESLWWKIGLIFLSGGLKQLKKTTDYQEYGGAPFLGFEHIVIKAHGRSRQRALANAVKVASKAVRGNVCQEIEEAVATFDEKPLIESPNRD